MANDERRNNQNWGCAGAVLNKPASQEYHEEFQRQLADYRSNGPQKDPNTGNVISVQRCPFAGRIVHGGSVRFCTRNFDIISSATFGSRCFHQCRCIEGAFVAQRKNEAW